MFLTGMHIETARYNRVKYILIKKLVKRRLWGNAYVPCEKLLRSVRGHERGIALNVLRQLVKEGFLILHKNGACVSLSPRMLPEIMHFVRDNLDNSVVY